MVRNCPWNEKNNSQMFSKELTGLGQFLCLLVDSTCYPITYCKSQQAWGWETPSHCACQRAGAPSPKGSRGRPFLPRPPLGSARASSRLQVVRSSAGQPQRCLCLPWVAGGRAGGWGAQAHLPVASLPRRVLPGWAWLTRSTTCLSLALQTS